jgi:deoxyribonuclease V
MARFFVGYYIMLSTNYNTITPSEAVALQKELRDKVQLTPLQHPVKTVAGADISFNKFSEIVYACIIVLSYPDMKPIAQTGVVTSTKFPYIPGLLGFREVPALVEAWNKLDTKPDVLILDGHGIAHPRRMGIATHFGLVAHTPTLGCAKSLLTGKYEEPGSTPGSISPLTDKGEVIGQVLRTKLKCKPVYISPGHLITLEQSVEIIRQCIGRYRIPEPTRMAHILVNQLRTENKAEGLF